MFTDYWIPESVLTKILGPPQVGVLKSTWFSYLTSHNRILSSHISSLIFSYSLTHTLTFSYHISYIERGGYWGWGWRLTTFGPRNLVWILNYYNIRAVLDLLIYYTQVRTNTYSKYIYIHTNAHMHLHNRNTYKYVEIYRNTHKYNKYIWIQIKHKWIYIDTHRYIHIHANIYKHTHGYVHTWIQTDTQKYTFTVH